MRRRSGKGSKSIFWTVRARNLRDGTINHYQESIKQIYKRITPDTLISSMCQQTMANFYISLRDDPNLNEVSMGTYAMRFENADAILYEA